MSFQKITAATLRNNDDLFSFLGGDYVTIEKSRKGDGVFVGGGGIASDVCRPFGIVLPKGGMIIPNDRPERIKGMIFPERIRRKRLANEQKLAEMQVIWDSFCERNNVEFFVAVYHLQQKLNAVFGLEGMNHNDPVQEIRVQSNMYWSWYHYTQLYPNAVGGLADFSRYSFSLKDMREATFRTVVFNGKEYPFSADSISKLSDAVDAFINAHKSDEGVQKRLEQVEDRKRKSALSRQKRGVTIDSGCYFQNGDSLIGNEFTMGNNCYVGTLVRIGKGAVIGNNVCIVGGAIKPGATVPDGTVVFPDEMYPPMKRSAGLDELGNYTEVAEYHRYPSLSVTNDPEKAESLLRVDGYRVRVSMQWGSREYGIHMEVLRDKNRLAHRFFEIVSGFDAYCLGEYIIAEIDNTAVIDEVVTKLEALGVSFPEGFRRVKKSARYKQVEDPDNPHRYKPYDRWCDNPFRDDYFIESEVTGIDVTVALWS